MRGNKPSKKDRLQAYILALKWYREDMELSGNNESMCYYIREAMVELFGRGQYNFDVSCYNFNNGYYPELYSVRPKGATAYWWSKNDTKSRIDAFNKMVLMLKN